MERVSKIYNRLKGAKEKHFQSLETYDTVAKQSSLNEEFLVLLVGSCLITTFGLFQNSVTVIIGAMLIAPLMMPILGFSLAALWGDQKLLLTSVITLITGSIIVLVITSCLVKIIPGVEFNEQIQARINPNLYDIFVAVASGFAGAYAFANPKISTSISGVAIAVALMPPLCVIGISIGLNNWTAARGATLLYITNLIGISLASSLMFWRLRFHPITKDKKSIKKRAKKSIFFSLSLLILIALPLGFFTRQTFLLKEKEEKIRTIITSTIKSADILKLVIRTDNPSNQVNVALICSEIVTSEIKSSIYSKIRDLFSNVSIEIKFIQAR